MSLKSIRCNGVTVSRGNTKMGTVYNVSLPPGLTCPKGVPCFNEGCYAQHLMAFRPGVRQAWESNYAAYRVNPEGYFQTLSTVLELYRPRMFRWHVGGDFPDERYFRNAVALVR